MIGYGTMVICDMITSITAVSLGEIKMMLQQSLVKMTSLDDLKGNALVKMVVILILADFLQYTRSKRRHNGNQRHISVPQ